MVKVLDARLEGKTWIVTLASESLKPGGPAAEDRAIQIEAVGGSIKKVELDGAEVALEQRAEGDTAIRCRFSNRHVMRVEIS